MEEYIKGAFGFNGKPVIDIRALPVVRIQDLSRVQMRDVMYSLGKERPTWEIPKLRSMMISIVTALKTNNLGDITALEHTLGIRLPRSGVEFQPRIYSRTPVAPTTSNKSKASGNMSIQDQERLKKAKEKRICLTCGQMARAICYYKCCKSCCMQMKNPCTIHVLLDERNFHGRGYGTVCSKVDYSDSFPRVQDATAANMPRLRDLRESVATFQEETAEVLKWRKKVIENNEKAEKEYAVEALERYELNAALLAEVISVEDLAQIALEPSKKKHKQSKEEMQEFLKTNDTIDRDTKNLEKRCSDITALQQFLKKMNNSKQIGDLNQSIKSCPLLRNLNMEDLNPIGEWALDQPILKERSIKYNDMPQIDKSSMINIAAGIQK